MPSGTAEGANIPRPGKMVAAMRSETSAEAKTRSEPERESPHLGKVAGENMLFFQPEEERMFLGEVTE